MCLVVSLAPGHVGRLPVPVIRLSMRLQLHELQVLPLQAASMLLVTLPWTLPRLMDLQAANPVAVLDGR